MKQISAHLWQSDAHSAAPPTDDAVIYWMCGNAPAAPLGCVMVDFPIHDSDKGVPPEVFKDLVHLAFTFAHRPVLTVCQCGENRSGLMSALTLIARGFAVDRAIEIVQLNGPLACSKGDKRRSFWNEAFVKQVKEFFADEAA